MTISKTGLKKNSYRNFTLVLDRKPEGGFSGLMYHDIRPQGVSFSCLMDLVCGIEEVLEETHCPMPSMNQRRFGNAPALRKAWEEESRPRPALGEGAMTLQLCITYRYHATWQGSVTWIEKGITSDFASFLELIRWIGTITGEELERPETGGRIFCRLSVDEADNHKLGGRFQQGVRNTEQQFSGIMELIRCLDGASVQNGNEGETRLISAWTVGSYRKHGRKATFAIRILFREHATWQGIICWKEMGQEVRFRSFLEMALLMDAACAGQTGWREEKEAHLLVHEV